MFDFELLFKTALAGELLELLCDLCVLRVAVSLCFCVWELFDERLQLRYVRGAMVRLGRQKRVERDLREGYKTDIYKR